MSHAKFVAVVFLLASVVVQANQCSCNGECPSAALQNGVSLLQKTLQTNVIQGTKTLVQVDVEESGTVGAAAVAAKLRQSVMNSILVVLVVCVLMAAHRVWPVLGALIFPSLYICIAAVVIDINGWLMRPGHFPFPLALTGSHMLTSWLLAGGLSRIRPSSCPSLQTIEVTWSFLLKFVPLGIAFALSIVCGNAAYQFLSVAFLQAIKQSNIVIIYTLSVLCGLEALRRCSVIILFGIFCGTTLAVHGEMHFILVGFVLQVVSSVADSSKIVMQSILMSGTCKLDPLTTVLFMAPACLFTIAIPFLILEAPRGLEIITQFHLVLPMVIFSCMLAFSLNVVVAHTIKQCSPVGYLCVCIVKNISIIVSSSWFLGESLSAQQDVGLTMALSGVALYSLYKQNRDCFDDDNLLQGFSRVAKRCSGLQQDKTTEELASATSKSTGTC